MGECANNTTTTSCGYTSSSTNAHRSRTPERILTSSDTQTLTLDAAVHKNWHVDLLHNAISVTLSNVVAGRRGHVVLSNRITEDSTVTITNTDLIVNLTGPYVVAQDKHLVLRYYGDLDRLVVEAFLSP